MPAQLEIIGLRAAQEAINRLGLAAKDTRTVRADIGEEMLRRIEKRFATETGPDGERWKRSRRAEREGGQTLRQTNALRSSIHYDVSDGNLNLYSSDKKARVHQLGLSIYPKPGHQYLTIPLRAEGGEFGEPEKSTLSRKGRDRRRAAHYNVADEGVGRTWVARVHGKLYLFQATGEHTVRALFLLVGSVTMIARPFLGFGQDDIAMVIAMLSEYLGDAFDKTS